MSIPFSLQESKRILNLSYSDFHNQIAARVKGQPELAKITTAVWVYIQSLVNNDPVCYHALLSAPSGCGKTETYRAIKDWMADNIAQVPVHQIDMTSITEEGFKGKDTEGIVEPLLEDKENCGIIFLDELDKKIIPCFDNKGSNINRAVQSQLLTAIEGRLVEDKKSRKIDTHFVLFIACGAFDFVREAKVEKEKENLDHRSLGFGESYSQKASPNKTHYEPITREDIIEAGGMFEFIGRFAFIVNYQPLSKLVLNQIIDSQVERLENELGICATLRPKMRTYLHSLANGRYGCRALWSSIVDTALSIYPQAMAKHGDNKQEQICITLLGPGKAKYHIEQLPELESEVEEEFPFDEPDDYQIDMEFAEMWNNLNSGNCA